MSFRHYCWCFVLIVCSVRCDLRNMHMIVLETTHTLGVESQFYQIFWCADVGVHSGCNMQRCDCQCVGVDGSVIRRYVCPLLDLTRARYWCTERIRQDFADPGVAETITQGQYSQRVRCVGVVASGEAIRLTSLWYILSTSLSDAVPVTSNVLVSGVSFCDACPIIEQGAFDH